MSSTRVAILTDMHLSRPGTDDGTWNNPVLLSRSRDLLADAVSAIAAEAVDTVIVLGDTTQSGDAESAEAAFSVIAERVGVPVWAVPGNHDVAVDCDRVLAAADGTDGVTALDPRPRALAPGVDVCGVRIASDDGGSTARAVRLPEALPDDDPLLVLATHYPVLSVKPRLHARGLRYPGDLVNRREVERLVSARTAPTVVLHGHVHAAVTVTSGALLQIGCAALVEWPHGWTLVEVDTGAAGVAVRRRRLSRAAPPVTDTTLAPSEADWRYAAGAWVAGAHPQLRA